MSVQARERGVRQAQRVDLALSFAPEDGALVERLRAALAERGLRVAAEGAGDAVAGALGLVVTPRSLASGVLAGACRYARAVADDGGPRALALLFDGAEAPDTLTGLPSIDFADPEAFERAADRIIWPGLTGRQVVFVGVHSGYRAPWPSFRRELDRIGPRFVQGENLNRARYHVRQIARAGTHRIVVVTDIFEDWPSYRWPRRNSPQQYADLLFDLRDKTRGTPDAVAVLLYHHSRAFEEAGHGLDAHRLRRLRRCCCLHEDLAEEALPSRLRAVWNRLQRELLEAEREGERA